MNARTAALLVALSLLAPARARAEVVCSGSITSVQGEGMVHRSHRFELEQVAGNDLVAVLDRCRQIARQRQARALKRNPGGNFRDNSELDLLCSKGSEKFTVKRSISTAP